MAKMKMELKVVKKKERALVAGINGQHKRLLLLYKFAPRWMLTSMMLVSKLLYGKNWHSKNVLCRSHSHIFLCISLSLSLKIASQHQSLLSLLVASRSAIYKTQEIWKFYEWVCLRFWADFIVYMSAPATATASVQKADEVSEWMVVLFFYGSS